MNHNIERREPGSLYSGRIQLVNRDHERTRHVNIFSGITQPTDRNNRITQPLNHNNRITQPMNRNNSRALPVNYIYGRTPRSCYLGCSPGGTLTRLPPAKRPTPHLPATRPFPSVDCLPFTGLPPSVGIVTEHMKYTGRKLHNINLSIIEQGHFFFLDALDIGDPTPRDNSMTQYEARYL